jgi:hypothetical protein
MAVLVSALMWAMSGRAQQPSSIQADKDGEFTITQPTKVGDLTLEAGTYAVQHHTSKGKDVLRFMMAKTERELQLTRSYTGWVNKTELHKVADVPVDATTAAKAPATTMTITYENGTPRITQITIKGKSAVYDLPRK